MNHAEQRMDNMLFDEQTTYRTDYRINEIREYPKTVYKERPLRYKQTLPVYKSHHTLIDWKKQRPPFSTFHVAKDVIRTNPNNVQQPLDETVDHQREEVQKTRPRLVMTPAVSLDDIEDPVARNLIVSDMYTTDNKRNMKAPITLALKSEDKAPLPGLPAPSNPIVLPKLQPPYVSPEWRMESVTWDQRQLRSYCNPTERFWLLQGLPKCKACEESSAVQAHRKMLRDLKKNKV